MVGTRSLSSGRAFARARWLCPPYEIDSNFKQLGTRAYNPAAQIRPSLS